MDQQPFCPIMMEPREKSEYQNFFPGGNTPCHGELAAGERQSRGGPPAAKDLRALLLRGGHASAEEEQHAEGVRDAPPVGLGAQPHGKRAALSEVVIGGHRGLGGFDGILVWVRIVATAKVGLELGKIINIHDEHD